ncbi:MAG: class I SAM-dependent methyltransferase [Anaerolineae bacterium]|jgi:ubiquinone/menaquinone biosynthesis C-methylase UbiE
MRNPFTDPTIAETYESWYTTSLGQAVAQAEKAALLGLAELRSGETALDVGCGTGHFTQMLAEAGAQAAGCDASEAMLHQAARTRQELRWQLADARELPYADATWDLVLSVTMLEFVEEPARALDEMWRVLAPGGRLVVAVLQVDTPWHALYTRQAQQGPSPFAMAHFYGRNELGAYLQGYGKPHLTTAVHFSPDGRPPRCLALVESWGRLTRPSQAAMLVGRVSK